jgi:secreted Zn-dependent insulinase-like peptidase
LAFPVGDAHRIKYIWKASAPEHYFEILKSLRPDNMISMLKAKGVETNLTEKYFGIQYSLQNLMAFLCLHQTTSSQAVLR